MKITTNNSKYIRFKSKHTKGLIYHEDGSGYLIVGYPNQYAKYVSESGKHRHRMGDIKSLADLYSKAYCELLSLRKKLKKYEK